MKLALAAAFRQIPHVRLLALVAAALCTLAVSARADRRTNTLKPSTPAIVAGAAPARPASNPAFLGIRMKDHGLGCLVDGVTTGSAAQDAGLHEWDLILAIDGVRTSSCSTVRSVILGNAPGHVVHIDVRRGAEHLQLQAPLSTRAEVLHRRLVGHTMESTEVIDADDARRSYDLADTRGKTVVVGWFMLDRCTGCSAVFDRINDALARRLEGTNVPVVLAVSPEPVRVNVVASSAVKTVHSLRKEYGFSTTVPLALASDATFEELAIDDPERIHFMVIDCRGVVRFVAPIAPGSEDLEAAIDEVLAAAEQAEYARTHRR
jgi:peroxiredoxin